MSKFLKNTYFKKTLKKAIVWFILVAFNVTTLIPSAALAQVIGVDRALTLPAVGSLVPLSQPFSPCLIKGIKVFPDNPFQLDFIVDLGDSGLSYKDGALNEQALKMVKYFLASLTTPEEDMWVNLSPNEPDRIIPKDFGTTEMGRDLLAQDYILKQITSSLMYPEGETGKKFWKNVYKKAYDKYGTTDIPVDSFNKVWIIPDKAVVATDKEKAFVVESKLRVMLEEEYLASSGERLADSKTKNLTANRYTLNVQTEIIKEIIIPELEQEVNFGENFTLLRQIYHAMILATWFKKNIKESILSKVYVDQKKVGGLEIEKAEIDTEKIYKQYLESFKNGAYNYIKEEYDVVSKSLIPRKYFSGGVDWAAMAKVQEEIDFDQAMISQEEDSNLAQVSVNIDKPKPAFYRDTFDKQKHFTEEDLDKEIFNFLLNRDLIKKNGSDYVINENRKLSDINKEIRKNFEKKQADEILKVIEQTSRPWYLKSWVIGAVMVPLMLWGGNNFLKNNAEKKAAAAQQKYVIEMTNKYGGDWGKYSKIIKFDEETRRIQISEGYSDAKIKNVLDFMDLLSNEDYQSDVFSSEDNYLKRKDILGVVFSTYIMSPEKYGGLDGFSNLPEKIRVKAIEEGVLKAKEDLLQHGHDVVLGQGINAEGFFSSVEPLIDDFGRQTIGFPESASQENISVLKEIGVNVVSWKQGLNKQEFLPRLGTASGGVFLGYHGNRTPYYAVNFDRSSSDEQGSLVSVSEFSENLRQNPNLSDLVIFLDSCYSGAFADEMIAYMIRNGIDLPKAIITSTEGDETSWSRGKDDPKAKAFFEKTGKTLGFSGDYLIDLVQIAGALAEKRGHPKEIQLIDIIDASYEMSFFNFNFGGNRYHQDPKIIYKNNQGKPIRLSVAPTAADHQSPSYAFVDENGNPMSSDDMQGMTPIGLLGAVGFIGLKKSKGNADPDRQKDPTEGGKNRKDIELESNDTISYNFNTHEAFVNNQPLKVLDEKKPKIFSDGKSIYRFYSSGNSPESITGIINNFLSAENKGIGPQVLDYGKTQEKEGHYFIHVELIDGENLRTLAQKQENGTLTSEQTDLFIAFLEKMIDQKVVIYDLAPSQFVLGKTGWTLVDPEGIMDTHDWNVSDVVRKYREDLIGNKGWARVSGWNRYIDNERLREFLNKKDQELKNDKSIMKAPGGIDLNPKNLTLESKGEKIEFKMPENLEDFKNINGFVPTIIQIVPLTNLPAFLGMKQEPSSKETLAKI